MIDTVESLGYSKKLGKYGFPKSLCATEYCCKQWVDFCKKNNMKWLGGYATLVHKNFDNHFTHISKYNTKTEKILTNLGIIKDNKFTVDVNHSNVLQSKITGKYILTTSPNYFEWSDIEKYPYSVYFIHPCLLEDYNLDKRVNLAYTNMSVNELNHINKCIYEDIGVYKAFRIIK